MLAEAADGVGATAGLVLEMAGLVVAVRGHGTTSAVLLLAQ